MQQARHSDRHSSAICQIPVRLRTELTQSGLCSRSLIREIREMISFIDQGAIRHCPFESDPIFDCCIWQRKIVCLHKITMATLN